MPKISVNIPVYNGEKTIARAVQSILSQSFADFELIVVNDASQDATPRILNEFKDPRIKLIHHEQNQGISRTRNTALSNSHGEYVMVLDADDVALPDRMRKQALALDQDQALDGSFSWSEHLSDDPDAAPSGHSPRPNPAETRELILFQNPFLHSSACLRRRVMGRGYREDLSCAEDYAKWLELIFSGKRLALLHEPLIRYRAHAPTHYTLEKLRAAVKKLHVQYFNEVFEKSLSDEEAEAQSLLFAGHSDRAVASRQEAIALLSEAESWISTLTALEPRDPSIDRARLLAYACAQYYHLAAQSASIVGLGITAFSHRFPPVKRLKLLIKSQMPMSA